MKHRKGFSYSVLFTRTDRQEALKYILQNSFPEEHGQVFLPMYEHYRRDRKEIEQKALFPGYLFIFSDLAPNALYEYVRKSRIDMTAFVKTLNMEKIYNQWEPLLEEDNGANLWDLTDEEENFLEQMLDEKGILRMSAGYLESGKAIVVEGPLVGLDERIDKLDRRNKQARLKSLILGREVYVGLDILPKRVFFPNDKDAPEVLSDGTEINLEALKKTMNGFCMVN